MDISVSHLNNRLSFQLPQELPLGLVFVSGTVSFSDSAAFTELVAHGRYKHVHFDLIDDKHRIRCVLVVRAVVDFELEYGVRVRVGGHLRFDPQRADYYLLARDLERLDVDLLGDGEEMEVDQAEVEALLADIRKRTNQQKAPSDLPQWVQELAPEAVQDRVQPAKRDGTAESDVALEAATEEKLASSISALLDEMDDVELTPDMIESLEDEQGVKVPEPPSTAVSIQDVELPKRVHQASDERAVASQSWLLWLLAGVLILLLCAVVTLLLFAL